MHCRHRQTALDRHEQLMAWGQGDLARKSRTTLAEASGSVPFATELPAPTNFCLEIVALGATVQATFVPLALPVAVLANMTIKSRARRFERLV